MTATAWPHRDTPHPRPTPPPLVGRGPKSCAYGRALPNSIPAFSTASLGSRDGLLLSVKTLLRAFAACGIVGCSDGASSPPVPQPVIDMHMHAPTGPIRDGAGAPLGRPCDPQPCTQQAAAFHDSSIVQATIDAMRKYNVVRAVISSGDVARYMKLAPDRFIPSAGIPPLPGDTSLQSVDSLRAAIRDGRFRALGEIGTQYMGLAPSDSRLEPYFALAEELDVPVLIHTAGLGAHVPSFHAALGRPLLLEPVVEKHPRLRLYFENAGYPFLDEAIALMTLHPQVYADISTITWIIPRDAFYRYLRALVEAGLGKRLMFGSDQIAWPEVIGPAIASIQDAPFLTADQKRDILYNNAARFLRLGDTASLRGALPNRR
jgi:predicted TIM-barrel fold metal-dependent hydrolase